VEKVRAVLRDSKAVFLDIVIAIACYMVSLLDNEYSLSLFGSTSCHYCS
jgi:hypothetical protein